MSLPRILLIKAMLEKEPEDSFLNYALALEHIANEEFPEAIRIMTAILQRDENYLAAYYQLGKLYEKAGQMNDAIKTSKNDRRVIIHQLSSEKYSTT